MNNLASYSAHHEKVIKIIQPVLSYFGKANISEAVKTNIGTAADFSFSDKILLEKFENWLEGRDDQVFLFHINRYFENKDKKPLPIEERDVTYKKETVEENIKKTVRSERARVFGERISSLAIKYNLTTNKALGEFLDVSEEEARRYKEGLNKPQSKTIKKVADKFEVSMEYLVGITDDPSI